MELMIFFSEVLVILGISQPVVKVAVLLGDYVKFN